MGERLKNYLKVVEQRLIAWEKEASAKGGKQSRQPQPSAQGVENAPLQSAGGGGESLLEGETLPGEGQEQIARAQQLTRAKQELLTQIGFFQHERLVHLIVTVLFALLSLLVLIWLTLDFRPEVAVLLLLLLVLLLPYIRHYYILENGTQKLYQYYDRLEALLEKAEFSDMSKKEKGC